MQAASTSGEIAAIAEAERRLAQAHVALDLDRIGHWQNFACQSTDIPVKD